MRGDRPSAFSAAGFANRKELASTAFERTRMPMVVADARDPEQRIVLANRAFLNLTGYTAEEIVGRNCRMLQGEGTSAAAIEEIRAGLAAQLEINVELFNYRKDGTGFWNRLHISPIQDDDGRPLYYFASQLDVTEQRKIQALEEAEHRLLMEVDHRSKNVLAIVESIVRLSDASDPVLYANAIQQRVQALARLHILLSERGWNDLALAEVIDGQVAPFAGARADIHGPEIMLPAVSVQPLGLMVHELVVNALRHGALATPGGRVSISWQPDGSGFVLDWRETRSEPIAKIGPKGFGSAMIGAFVEQQLKGRIERDWTAAGLAIRISVPALQ